MIKAMKKVTGSLKVDLAQFRAHGGVRDVRLRPRRRPRASSSTAAQRLMELLKQPQYSPYPVEEQVVSIWAGTTGKLDEVAGRRRAALRAASSSTTCAASTTASSTRIRETKKFDDDTAQALDDAVRRVPRRSSRPPKASSIKVGHEAEAEALEDEDVEQEQIVKQKR